MSVSQIVSMVFIIAGSFFFFTGTLGILRFPDLYCRLHAVTKVDNVGFGLIAVGLMVQAGSLMLILKLILIWALVIFSSSTTSHLIARTALSNNIRPWRRQ